MCYLVVGILDINTHFIEHIKVTTHVQRFQVLFILEVEELQLRANIEGIAHIRCPLQVPFQYVAGVPFERVSTGLPDIAEHPGYGIVLAGPPRYQSEGIRVRQGYHVTLVNPGKALN